jgi:hypothetical protein
LPDGFAGWNRGLPDIAFINASCAVSLLSVASAVGEVADELGGSGGDFEGCVMRRPADGVRCRIRNEQIN